MESETVGRRLSAMYCSVAMKRVTRPASQSNMLPVPPYFQISQPQCVAQSSPIRSRSTVDGISSDPMVFPHSRRATWGKKCWKQGPDLHLWRQPAI